MSAYFVLRNPEIFIDPAEFQPDRWLGPDARTLEPYFVPFSRGPRSCVGQNLAWAELHTLLASIIRRFPNLTLYDTTPDDVMIIHDYFSGMWKYKKGSLCLQVKG